jgi:hypothetical protein
MPWWGFALCGFGLWLVGLITGRAAGRAEILQQLVTQQARMQGVNPLLGLPSERPGNASERKG